MPVPFTSTEPVKLSIEDEGIRLAPTPVTEKSRNAIANASRTPRERLGDLKAQQAANLTGVRRLEALLELRRDDGTSIIRLFLHSVESRPGPR